MKSRRRRRDLSSSPVSVSASVEGDDGAAWQFAGSAAVVITGRVGGAEAAPGLQQGAKKAVAGRVSSEGQGTATLERKDQRTRPGQSHQPQGRTKGRRAIPKQQIHADLPVWAKSPERQATIAAIAAQKRRGRRAKLPEFGGRASQCGSGAAAAAAWRGRRGDPSPSPSLTHNHDDGAACSSLQDGTARRSDPPRALRQSSHSFVSLFPSPPRCLACQPHHAILFTQAEHSPDQNRMVKREGPSPRFEQTNLSRMKPFCPIFLPLGGA